MKQAAMDGSDPFGKVKELISNMIDTLEKDGAADSSHKAYCDKETGETLEKKTYAKATIEKLSTQIDSMKAKSTQLKEEVAERQAALADLARTQAKMTKMRNEEKATFAKNKREMESGIEGVKLALRMLSDYYGQEDHSHDAATGSSQGIIGLLEVVESDFTKTFAEMKVAENTAQDEYDRTTRANEIEKATTEQDVKYKTREQSSLDKAVAEATSDRTAAQSELDAIMEYNARLIKMCEEKAETYSQRSSRRDAEIAGLRQALSILDGEAALLQRDSRSARHLRAITKHNA
jgi:hypothetical protein